MKRIFMGLGLLSGLVGAQAQEGKPAAGGLPTIAYELLELESAGTPTPDQALVLNYLIQRAAAKFGGLNAGESEEGRARRFFQAVDAALIESNVIFPPQGHMELLREALTPRVLSEEEFRHAGRQLANLRRRVQLESGYGLGGKFFFFDCDLASVLYVAVAEKLGQPVFMVELPGHNFVRWQSPQVYLNWDPNDGVSLSDEAYANHWRVTPGDAATMGYLQNMPRVRVASYWWVLCAQEKVRGGDEVGAVADFRQACRVAPDSLAAQNELAWALATNADAAVRDGREALKLAEALTARSRCVNWLETLAAAHAEAGNFPQAEAVEEEARRIVATAGNASASLPWYDACVAAYAKGYSYARAVQAGRLKIQEMRATQGRWGR